MIAKMLWRQPASPVPACGNPLLLRATIFLRFQILPCRNDTHYFFQKAKIVTTHVHNVCLNRKGCTCAETRFERSQYLWSMVRLVQHNLA